MRGEHFRAELKRGGYPGSSPHARGTREGVNPWFDDAGIIPACAGNTPGTSASTSIRRDHPRMRGEHVVERRSRRGFKGSSPHARGTLPSTGSYPLGTGIIPACAGNTLSSYPASGRRWDHPRMRGEHLLFRRTIPGRRGSSPHARGTHFPIVAPSLIPGIIPACAGNTYGLLNKGRMEEDHPRMRGEHQYRAFG